MKRILTIMAAVVCLVACEKPVALEILVKDVEGNNLLDYGWLDGKNVTAVIRIGKKLESGKKYGIVIPSSLYNKNGINTVDDYAYEFYVK